MHLVSTVTGLLAEDRTALDAVMACFPAGTLSARRRSVDGAHRRGRKRPAAGLYGGVGFLDAGNADFAIAIRTALMRNGTAYVQAGRRGRRLHGPYEYTESASKAKTVLNAIAAAETLSAP